MSTSAYHVVLTRNEVGYFAHCPSLNGCHGLGETPEEALAGFKASLEFYVQTLPDAQGRDLLKSVNLGLHPESLSGSCAQAR